MGRCGTGNKSFAPALEDIEKGRRKIAFERSGYPELKGWSYRNMWWITENKRGAFSARAAYV